MMKQLLIKGQALRFLLPETFVETPAHKWT